MLFDSELRYAADAVQDYLDETHARTDLQHRLACQMEWLQSPQLLRLTSLHAALRSNQLRRLQSISK